MEFPGGWQVSAGDGSEPKLRVLMADKRAAAQLLLNPELAFGELFMDGRLQVLNGTIYDLLDLLGRNLPHMMPPQVGRVRHALRSALKGLTWRNSARRSRQNVHHHYDIDDRIYALFLDSDRQYSCGYFESARSSLEEAQLAKKRHIAAKLLVPPDATVLDIGCGWGGMALYLSELCNADVTGLTLSGEQLKVAKGRAEMKHLDSHVHFRLQDYRALEGAFDRVVSVGMFEHVGRKDFATFFNVVRRSLKDDGIALLHSIGRLDGKSPTNPWFEKYIFPGSYLPSLAEILPAIEQSGLIVTDIEILRLHYADTLAAWRQKFISHRADAAVALGERFCRMWEFYLAAAEAGFRYGGLVVFQIQLAKELTTVPRTRAYIAREEERLRQFEQASVSRAMAAE